MPFEFSVSDLIPASPQDIYDAWLSSSGHEWRTTKFTDTDADSQIEVLLQPAAGGTTVTVRHSNVPDSHTSYRDGGWQRSYFEPMKQHFKRAR